MAQIAPDLEVVAHDTGARYEAPTTNAALELAKSLGAIAPQVNTALLGIAQRGQEAASAQAKRDALASSGAAFADAVRNKQILPTQNPWYVQAYNEEAAKVSGGDALSALKQDSASWPEQSDSQAYADRWRTEVGKLSEQYQNKDQLNGFMSAAAPATQQALEANQSANVKRITEDRINNITSLVADTVAKTNQAQAGNATAEQIFGSIQPLREQFLGTGGTDTEFDQIILQGVNTAARNQSDPDLLDVLKFDRGAPSVEGPPAGQLVPGNLDLNARPVVKNANGSISTVRSITIEADGKAILIPTVIGNKVVSNADALEHYKQTGEHLGVFDTEANADAYAQSLHESQAKEYAGPRGAIYNLPNVADKVEQSRYDITRAAEDQAFMAQKVRAGQIATEGSKALDDLYATHGAEIMSGRVDPQALFSELTAKGYGAAAIGYAFNDIQKSASDSVSLGKLRYEANALDPGSKVEALNLFNEAKTRGDSPDLEHRIATAVRTGTITDAEGRTFMSAAIKKNNPGRKDGSSPGAEVKTATALKRSTDNVVSLVATELQKRGHNISDDRRKRIKQAVGDAAGAYLATHTGDYQGALQASRDAAAAQLGALQRATPPVQSTSGNPRR